MKELMEKYNVGINFVMFVASVDNLTLSEIQDLDYMEDRIVTHLENFTSEQVKLIQ